MGEITRVRPLELSVVVAMVVAAFGPYLVGGVRTEQLFVYGTALVALPLGLLFARVHGGLKFLVPWTMLLVVAMLGLFFPLRRNAPWDAGAPLAGVDNLLLPIAVMLAVWCTVKASSAEVLLCVASKIIVWGMAINAVLAVVNTRIDLSSILRPFWGSENLDSTTALRASTMGRISGIFNQPAEAGVAYGLAGLLAIYLYQRQPKRLALALLLISIGGVLTVSKIFLIGGIALILIYMWRSRSLGARLTFVVSAVLLACGVLQSGLLDDWGGAAFITRLLNPPETAGLIEYYTANRWAQGSDMFQVIGTAVALSPIVGVGAGGWEVAYDSAWTQAVVVGGAIGALCILTVYFGVFVLARKTPDTGRRTLNYFLAWLLLGASLGIPALSANRVATLIWVVIALLVLANHPPEDAKKETSFPASRLQNE